MALVLADIGADAILGTYFNNAWPGAGNNLTMGLYTNDISPADTSTKASFTAASGGGYAAATLTRGSWTVNAANDPSDAVYAEETYTFTGALSGSATIYGYYVFNADDVLIWAERLATSFTPANNGDALKITPKFQLSKGTPS